MLLRNLCHNDDAEEDTKAAAISQPLTTKTLQ